MEFFLRASGRPRRLGILPGTFHPPTCAHVALAQAGLAVADETVFVLPHELPHKRYEGAGFRDRIRMLQAAAAGEPRFSVAATTGGLFIEIARECRDAYGPETRLAILCGRDAADRIVNWNYGEAGAIARMLDEFELLVASRGGAYDPPAELRDRIHALDWEPSYEDISATEVRRRIAAGEPWEHLVPEAIVPLVRQIYRT